MAQADVRQMSEVREQHAAHPHRPRPATKPGVPESATVARPASPGHGPGRGSGGGSSANSAGRRNGGTRRSGETDQATDPSNGSGRGATRAGGKHLSLPDAVTGGHLFGGGDGGGDGVSLPHPHLSVWARLALKLVKRLAKHELRKLVKSAGVTLPDHLPEMPRLANPLEAVGHPLAALQGSGNAEAPGVAALRPSLPIQQSIDIAVPLEFAWRSWMQLNFLPEGVDEVVEIQRDDAGLRGRVAGAEWAAEILDEREGESFAWRSTQGSDCAGLVTFHRLSDRLTRIELTLDVVPGDPGQTALLLTHLAHRRVLRRMRRFKAELELVSPDVYVNDGETSPD
jgi:uncharacterized membrane protein